MKTEMRTVDGTPFEMRLTKGKLYVMASRPGMGQAWFALSMMHALGIKEGLSSLYLGDPEMKYFLQTDSKTKMVYLGAPGKGNESGDAVMDKRIAEWGTILCFRESEADDIEALCTELYREMYDSGCSFDTDSICSGEIRAFTVSGGKIKPIFAIPDGVIHRTEAD